VTVSNFTQTLPQFHLTTYLSTFAPRSFPHRIIVRDPGYAEALSRILNETPSEIVEAYLVARVALTLSSHLGLNTEPWKAVRSLEEELKGIKKGAVDDRAEFCISKVENTMGFAAGRYFVNETFTGDSKEKSATVISDIIKAFKNSLPNIEWMDEESASGAAEKVRLDDKSRVSLTHVISGGRNSRQGWVPDLSGYKRCGVYC
jgi:endothelin-converting enzyme